MTNALVSALGFEGLVSSQDCRFTRVEVQRSHCKCLRQPGHSRGLNLRPFPAGSSHEGTIFLPEAIV